MKLKKADIEKEIKNIYNAPVPDYWNKIENADVTQIPIVENPKRRVMPFYRIATVAACFVLVLTFSIIGATDFFSENSNQSNINGQKNCMDLKNIMDYEKMIQGNNYSLLSVDEFKSQTLENEYGFVFKIKVTDRYKNVLEYEMWPDVNGNFLTEYDDVVIDEDGYPTAKAIASSSYLLTTVIVEEIYYLGDALNINIGDNVEIAELCYIAAQASPYVFQQNESKHVLFCMEDMIKLEPDKEYIIFGYKNNDKESSRYGHLETVGIKEGVYQVDKEKEISFYEVSNRDLVINECIDKLKALRKQNGMVVE